VWSATSFSQLRRDALEADRWNLLHPSKPARQPYVNSVLDPAEGPIVAATDYMKIVADQIAPWLSGRLYSLGTDGFGRSDNRAHLRRHFEVDAECITLAALHQLVRTGKLPKKLLPEAIEKLKLDPEKANPVIS
jgi:pyruvate dehydrogenase E1 component